MSNTGTPAQPKKKKTKAAAWQQSIKTSRGISYLFFATAIICMVIHFVTTPRNEPCLYIAFVAAVIGVLLFLPVNNYIFDNQEYLPNNDIPGFVEKLRFRAILFNNLSVLVFLVIVFVIVCSFYLMITSQKNFTSDPYKINYAVITSIIGSVVVLIFLVQILFRLFKYLLRVGAFYNGKADAIELVELDKKYTLDPVLDSFTPNNYDISDVESPNLFQKP